MSRVAVIGGGVAGSSVAIYLQRLGIEVTLFEKRDSLVSGPPMCHLHAGGNLYPDIDDEQRLQLLKESIELLRFYPHVVDFRPTVIAVPKSDSNDPTVLLQRAQKLQKEYEKLIQIDPKNKVLGEPKEYVKPYSKEKLLSLQKLSVPKLPKSADEWMVGFSKIADLEKLKFPVLLIQEYGINVFRLAATAKLLIKDLCLQTEVIDIQRKEKKWLITYQKAEKSYQEEFDYIINAAGFESGKIDDLTRNKKSRYVEFKAAYVTKWSDTIYPEIIFLGKRGTKEGMAQFTPYPGGYFQLHGMTKEITLFEDGLVKSSYNSSYPKLPPHFIEKIEKGWSKEEIEKRTNKAIAHMSQFIPTFKTASIAAPPLFGAQQIPGDDPSLRAAEVSVEKDYARCEIVKASSILSMADAIVKDMAQKGLIDKSQIGSRDYSIQVDINKIQKEAKEIAKQRGYPAKMGELLISSKQ